MFFFLSCYFHHLDLHSFPTRRSSDLYFRRLETGLAQGWFPEEIPDEEKVRELGDGRVVQRIDRRTRSEEHTSELQSRGHLVCRLLLEKKKKENNTLQYDIK